MTCVIKVHLNDKSTKLVHNIKRQKWGTNVNELNFFNRDKKSMKATWQTFASFFLLLAFCLVDHMS